MHHAEAPPLPSGPDTRSNAHDTEQLSTREVPVDLRVFKILNDLRDRGVLAQEVARVRKRFGDTLGTFAAELGKRGWELLAVLDRFDADTADHCVNTYVLARTKVEKPLWNGTILANEFNNEHVDLQQFFRACVLHDVGKIEVPHAALVNRVTDEQCAEILFHHRDDVLIPQICKRFGPDVSIPVAFHDATALLEYIHVTLGTRPQAMTPLRLLLDQPITAELHADLDHCGSSPDDTLIDVVRLHDTYSERILTAIGYPAEGELAGAHHRNGHGTKKHRITVGALQMSVDLADIVHIADVHHAIRHRRHYKGEQTPLKALHILSTHAREGSIEPYAAYLWIADDMHTLQSAVFEGEEQKLYSALATFLDTERSRHLGWPDWKRVYAPLDVSGNPAA